VSKPLPDPAFVTLIVSPKGGGKTTLLLNMLNYYNKVFHTIYIYSATVKLDLKWKPFLDKLDESKEKKVFTKFSPTLLEKIMRERDEGLTPKRNILVIYDDMISDNATFAKFTKNTITRSVFNARHFGISTIIVSQKYTEIPANIRNQCDHLMISRLSQAELATVYDNMTGLGNIPLDQFQILYKYATQERFKFLNIDVIGGGVLYKNFDKIEWAEKRESKKSATKRQAAAMERKELKRRAKEILTSKGVLL
jgi:hypothetical protein